MLFIDQTVYYKFQNFRLLLSAKHADIGKRHLNLYLSGEKRALEHSSISEEIFMGCLASYPGTIKTKPHQTISWNSSKKEMSTGVEVQPGLSINSGRQIYAKPEMSQVFLRVEKLFPNVVKFFSQNIAQTWPKQAIGHENIEPSLNAYVYSIRYYNTREPTLTVCVSGNRFCLNVNRRHKNNNIMFVIDIVKFCFTQKCHDDMCRGYESPSFYLPPEIFFSTRLERKNNC